MTRDDFDIFYPAALEGPGGRADEGSKGYCDGDEE